MDLKPFTSAFKADSTAFAKRQVANLFKKSETGMPVDSMPVVTVQKAGLPKPVLYGAMAVGAILLLKILKKRG